MVVPAGLYLGLIMEPMLKQEPSHGHRYRFALGVLSLLGIKTIIIKKYFNCPCSYR
jgi:hypothetical protein